MFRGTNDLIAYVIDDYPEVTDQRIDEEHWDLQCPICKVVRGFPGYLAERRWSVDLV